MAELVVVGNYVEFPETSKMCNHENDDTIMFLGKMDYEPNITAVSYFVKNIFPSLKSKNHNLQFLIVGAQPSPTVKNLELNDGVRVMGFVESTEPYFQNSAIVIAPMLSGAGVQNKIIQAMSYGCCVATTTIGAEGLSLFGDDLLIYNTDEEWISGIEQLLRNRERRKIVGLNARNTISKTLTKDVVYKQFSKLFHKIRKRPSTR